ncbi:ABC transporter permease subunit [Lachnospiraceae bacterium KK002]
MRAFLKKEWMELCRSGRLLVLLLIFLLFGIMNPALAKMTPWLMETLSDSLADTGLTVSKVTIDAMDSWVQFYKNIPAGMVIVILFCSSSFTGEYQKGTLIPVVTKGLSRRKILLAKGLSVSALWTVSYWLCFGITYGYNAYFWDNGIAEHLFFAGAMIWLYGIWVLAFLIFFSTVAAGSTQVLLGTGGVILGTYILSMFPKFADVLPAKLMDGMSLLQGVNVPGDYAGGLAAAVCMILLCLVLATVCFDRKVL